MRKVFLLIIVQFIVMMSMAQTQQGVAYQHNGKQQRTPLGNVTISYNGNQRSVISNEKDGRFSLMLTGLKMGDRIGLVTVKKREMIVFNQHAVDEWSVRKEPLTLILCNADEFERQKENLIAIGRSQAKKKYERQKAELEKKLQEGEIKMAEKEAALDKAYEELERLQKNIGDYADLFARIDESEIDTLAQQAVDLFNCGEVERAIELFEQGRYMERLDKALQRSQQADRLKVVADQAKAQATEDSLIVLQTLKAQIEAYKLSNEWNKAGELLKGLADRLNTVDDCWDYADFCRNQNNFEDAEAYYQRAIAFLKNETDQKSPEFQSQKEALLNNLAILYGDTQRFAESETMYKEALEIHRRLASVNPQAYEPYVASTLNNLANQYSDTQRFAESEAMYKEALEIYRRLASANPQAYEPDVAWTLNNLAILYGDTQRFAESETMYKEALEIHRRLASANPQAYEPDVARTLKNLANLYYDTRRFTESEKMYIKSMGIYRRLALNNPQVYDPYVASVLNSLALLYSDIKRYAESETMCKEALEIRRRLAESNPQTYKLDVARTLNNLARVYYMTDQITEAKNTLMDILEIYLHLAVEDPEAYKSKINRTKEMIQTMNELQQKKE